MSESISSILLPLLGRRFEGQDMLLQPGGEPVAVFSAKHPEVGDIEIYDEGEELTIVVGNFTHTHFANYEKDLSNSERRARIANETVSFLDDLFADRIEMFGSHRRAGGTRYRRNKRRGTISNFIFGRKSYVWSGPLSNDA